MKLQRLQMGSIEDNDILKWALSQKRQCTLIVIAKRQNMNLINVNQGKGESETKRNADVVAGWVASASLSSRRFEPWWCQITNLQN